MIFKTKLLLWGRKKDKSLVRFNKKKARRRNYQRQVRKKNEITKIPTLIKIINPMNNFMPINFGNR